MVWKRDMSFTRIVCIVKCAKPMGAMAVKNLCRLIKGGEVELRKYVPYSITRKDPQM